MTFLETNFKWAFGCPADGLQFRLLIKITNRYDIVSLGLDSSESFTHIL